MKQVKIKRKEWLRGSFSQKFESTALFAEAVNAKCCLGHILVQAYNVPEEDLIGCSTPWDLAFVYADHEKKVTLPLVNYSSDGAPIGCNSLGDRAMEFNDEAQYSSNREELIKELFAPEGIEIEFVD